MNKEEIRAYLVDELNSQNRFWSYNQAKLDTLSDELLIEKTLMYLDIDESLLLFKIFPKSLIKKVWVERMLPQGPYYRNINRLYALIFFDIKHPDRYLKNKEKQFLKSIS